MKTRTIIIIIVSFLFISAVVIAVFGLYLLRPAKGQGSDQTFVVQEGMSLSEVADELENQGLITHKTLFRIWAEVKGHSRQIKAGEYRLNGRMPPYRILEIITKGIIISHAVTIPEGYSVVQIAELFAGEGLVDKERFLKLAMDPQVVERYGISSPSLEGYLYPDTYQFSRGLSAELIIDTMVKRFWHLVSPYKELADESGMTWNEVITLASIVEKETGLAEERSLIASVFLNRLRKRMRLESDPTVIYGIENFNGNLTRRDLSTRTPYNTYMIRGLPPGPIANPGLESIEAVLNPAQTDYFYFVSKNDGSHHFSRTLSEHNQAVRAYQKKRNRR
jgi:UPF0755 protein